MRLNSPKYILYLHPDFHLFFFLCFPRSSLPALTSFFPFKVLSLGLTGSTLYSSLPLSFLPHHPISFYLLPRINNRLLSPCAFSSPDEGFWNSPKWNQLCLLQVCLFWSQLSLHFACRCNPFTLPWSITRLIAAVPTFSLHIIHTTLTLLFQKT